MTRTTVRKHTRKGTKGVKRHTRRVIPEKRTVPPRSDQIVDVDEMYESLGMQWSSLGTSIRKLEDKHWKMRLEGALDGALPVISMEMINKQIDEKEEELKEVERKLTKLRPFRGQKLTLNQYSELIRK